MNRLFAGVRAPSTLGTFLRAFTFGHVRQLDAVAVPAAGRSGRAAPRCCPAPIELAYVDVDDTVRQTYGYAKQGAGRGYTGAKGLNALIAHRLHARLGAGDLRDPAAQGLDRLARGARPGWSPTRSPPRPRPARPGCGCCARTPRSTPTT